MNRSVIADAHRLVVKVGSSLVTNEGRGLDHKRLALWSAQIATLMAMGKEVVLVSSGAIAEGIKRLGWNKRPVALNELQAAAAVGQMGLMEAYERSFRVHGLQTAQILLTHADHADRERYLNARSTLRTLLDLKVVPIINENDTLTTEEIKVGDNDTLGALVTNLIEADALIILTDQRGLYSADPRGNPDAEFIHEAVAGTPELEAMAGGAGSSVGTGGMLTKILAAKRAARSGAHTVIVSGREDDVLARLGAGEAIGTQLLALNEPLAARRQWLADHLQVRGRLLLDDGAVRALREQGKSLLPIGVVEVVGDFHRGEVVACIDGEGHDIARGLVNYSAIDARRIARQPSGQIEALLGYMDEAELIHRDNLVLL
jgi:glutamate 5-kinase